MNVKLLYSETDDIEQVVQNWLDENGGIEIKHVVYGIENQCQHETVMIFYHRIA